MQRVSQETSMVDRADSLLSVFQGALSARSQAGWSRWLQGEIQRFLPHEALIAAWGDFKGGVVAFDVITRSPCLAVRAVPKHVIEGMMASLFETWAAAGQEPVVIEADDPRIGWRALFSLSSCALVHGVQDHRGRYDCIYLFVGPKELASPFSRQLCRMVLPFIDTGFRQLEGRGDKDADKELAGTGFSSSSFAEGSSAEGAHQEAFADSGFGEPAWGDGRAGERGSALTARELEIMQWVRMGKTNSEIAIILNLSTFTVKNHMRRIYKKLDVLNRAQAVGSLDRIHGITQHAGR
jgi:transcriptional regulator EpsA